MVQKPGTPAGVAVVLKGVEGAGKSVLGVALRRIAGPHGLMVSSPNHVIGNFNAHLRDLLFLEASEAFFAGDRAAANKLKALITDDALVIESKGVDAVTAPNLLHVIMTTNEEWCVPAGPESRRYFVLDVSNERIGDEAYFRDLFAQVNSDAAVGAMLHDLLAMDLSRFNVRRFPVTEALIDQRERSATGIRAWALDLAERATVHTARGTVAWRPFFTTAELFDDYAEWLTRNRFERGLPRTTFGRALKNELGLAWQRRAPSMVIGTPGVEEAPGYAVGAQGEFRDAVARAAGLLA
jgi:phage/plasmid-associated DNA primase